MKPDCPKNLTNHLYFFRTFFSNFFSKLKCLPAEVRDVIYGELNRLTSRRVRAARDLMAGYAELVNKRPLMARAMARVAAQVLVTVRGTRNSYSWSRHKMPKSVVRSHYWISMGSDHIFILISCVFRNGDGRRHNNLTRKWGADKSVWRKKMISVVS